MRKLKICHIGLPDRLGPSLTYIGKKQGRISARSCCFLIGIIITLLCGCSHFSDEYKARPAFEEANNLFNQGSCQASLNKYEQIIEKYPTRADRVLFEMGIIYAHPKNEQKDYQKSLECFQRLIKDYPGSGYKKDSELMIFNISNVIIKDETIAAQQTHIETL